MRATTNKILGISRRLPRAVSIVVGLAVAALGVIITFRPFASLAALIILIGVGLIVTGLATIVAGDHARDWVIGAAWIVAGLGVLAWPGLSTRGLALVVGVSLVVGGVVDIAAAVRGTRAERFAATVGGLASVVFGALALAWPDVTLLVVAVVFGARTFLFGVRLAWSALHRRSPEHAAAPARGRSRRVSHALVAVLGLMVASGLAIVSAKLREGEPLVDAFYDTPDQVPDEPGVLLRSEPYIRDVPQGARAWRILYTTTRDEGQQALDETARRCLGEPSVFVSILTSVATSMSIFSTTDLDAGPLGERLGQNVPTAPIAAPLLIAQGEADSLIVPAVQQHYVDGLCAAGQPLDYRTYPGLDHVPLVEPDSPLVPELVAWTVDRFAGAPFVSTCPT